MKKNSPYRKDKLYNKEKTIYGLCINLKSKEHFLFNRDYLVLPITLPDETIEHLKSICKGSTEDRIHGHGKFKPINLVDDGNWVTYFLFDDNCLPQWTKSSNNYDRSIYEV